MIKRKTALGNNFDATKSCRFFKNFDWTKLERKLLKPPFIPDLEHKGDIRCFAKYPPCERNYDEKSYEDFLI